MTYIRFLFVIFFIVFDSIAQVTPGWVRFFNGEDNTSDRGNYIATDKNHNVFIIGTLSGNKMIVIKYSPSGNLLWEKRHSNVSGYSVALDSNDNVYAMGWDTFGNCRIVKYTNNGDSIWGINYLNNTQFIPESYIVSKSGNSYIHFTVNGSALVKFNSNGSVAWLRRYFGTGSFSGASIYNRSIQLDNNENIYVAFTANKGQLNDHDFFLIKYNSNGDSLWTRHYDHFLGSYDRTFTIALDEFNHVYSVGVTLNAGLYYTVLVKYNNSGVFQWSKQSAGGDSGGRCVICKNGYVYITGSFYVINLGYSPVLKYNYEGNLIWTTYFNENSLEYSGLSIEIDFENNLCTGGNTYYNFSNYDIAIMKINSSGIKQWVSIYNGPGNGNDYPHNMKMDANNIIITGTSPILGNDFDIITLKYYNSIGIKKINNSIPVGFILHQNFPNPFNPETKVRFEIPIQSKITLRIFDINGNEIETLINQILSGGIYELKWSGYNYSSGVYFIKLISNNFSITKKLILLK